MSVQCVRNLETIHRCADLCRQSWVCLAVGLGLVPRPYRHRLRGDFQLAQSVLVRSMDIVAFLRGAVPDDGIAVADFPLRNIGNGSRGAEGIGFPRNNTMHAAFRHRQGRSIIHLHTAAGGNPIGFRMDRQLRRGPCLVAVVGVGGADVDGIGSGIRFLQIRKTVLEAIVFGEGVLIACGTVLDIRGRGLVAALGSSVVGALPVIQRYRPRFIGRVDCQGACLRGNCVVVLHLTALAVENLHSRRGRDGCGIGRSPCLDAGCGILQACSVPLHQACDGYIRLCECMLRSVVGKLFGLPLEGNGTLQNGKGNGHRAVVISHARDGDGGSTGIQIGAVAVGEVLAFHQLPVHPGGKSLVRNPGRGQNCRTGIGHICHRVEGKLRVLDNGTGRYFQRSHSRGDAVVAGIRPGFQSIGEGVACFTHIGSGYPVCEGHTLAVDKAVAANLNFSSGKGGAVIHLLDIRRGQGDIPSGNGDRSLGGVDLAIAFNHADILSRIRHIHRSAGCNHCKGCVVIAIPCLLSRRGCGKRNRISVVHLRIARETAVRRGIRRCDDAGHKDGKGGRFRAVKAVIGVGTHSLHREIVAAVDLNVIRNVQSPLLKRIVGLNQAVFGVFFLVQPYLIGNLHLRGRIHIAIFLNTRHLFPGDLAVGRGVAGFHFQPGGGIQFHLPDCKGNRGRDKSIVVFRRGNLRPNQIAACIGGLGGGPAFGFIRRILMLIPEGVSLILDYLVIRDGIVQAGAVSWLSVFPALHGNRCLEVCPFNGDIGHIGRGIDPYRLIGIGVSVIAAGCRDDAPNGVVVCAGIGSHAGGEFPGIHARCITGMLIFVLNFILVLELPYVRIGVGCTGIIRRCLHRQNRAHIFSIAVYRTRLILTGAGRNLYGQFSLSGFKLQRKGDIRRAAQRRAHGNGIGIGIPVAVSFVCPAGDSQGRAFPSRHGLDGVTGGVFQLCENGNIFFPGDHSVGRLTINGDVFRVCLARLRIRIRGKLEADIGGIQAATAPGLAALDIGKVRIVLLGGGGGDLNGIRSRPHAVNQIGKVRLQRIPPRNRERRLRFVNRSSIPEQNRGIAIHRHRANARHRLPCGKAGSIFAPRCHRRFQLGFLDGQRSIGILGRVV